MKPKIIAVILGISFCIGFVALGLRAQEKAAAPKKEKTAQLCPMMPVACPIMKGKAASFDPSVLLLLKSDLDLSPAQIDELKAIIKKSSEKAEAILTPEQKDLLKAMVPPPRRADKAHMHRVKMMGGKTMQKNSGSLYICPMSEHNVRSDKPGKCPKCGMALVRKDSTRARE